MTQRRRPSAGLAVGMLALFISLSQFAVGQQRPQEPRQNLSALAAKVLAQLENQITSKHLAKGAVKTKDIRKGAVKPKVIADGAVKTSALANGAVQGAKLAKEAVALPNMAPGSVDASILANNAVLASKLAPNAVTPPALAPDAVTAPALAPESVSTPALALNAITTKLVAPNAITTSLIATDAITSNLIAPNAITTPLLAPNAVGSLQIADNSITGLEIQNSAIGTPALAKVPSVALTRTNDMTFADSTGFSVVNVNFDVERWDTAGMFDPTDPETVTIPEDGIYQVTAHIEWSGTPANVIGGRVLSVLDGVTDLVFSSDPIDTSGAQVGVPAQGVSKQLELNAGDELVLGISQVLSPAGSAKVLANTRSPTFEVTWVAPPTD